MASAAFEDRTGRRRPDAEIRGAVVPGSLDSRTGGYIYDRRIVEGLRAKGWTSTSLRLDESFPQPTAAALAQAAEMFAALPHGHDDAGRQPRTAARCRRSSNVTASRLRIVALVHLPLAADIGIETRPAARFADRGTPGAGGCGRIVVTGRATLQLMAGVRLVPFTGRRHRARNGSGASGAGIGGSPRPIAVRRDAQSRQRTRDLLSALAAVRSRAGT